MIFKKGESLGRFHFPQDERALRLLWQRPSTGAPRKPQLEFSQAWEIYRSDVALQLETTPQGTPPASIVAMSFNRLFLGGLLSSRARLHFTGYEYCAGTQTVLTKPSLL